MTTSKIKILPDRVVNRIAAGEVIERPASIVKELVDNSVDANSTEIIIRLRDGGKTSIAVSDNGEGMTPQDALMAFERHATSKLASEDDLSHISTLGFRGEALPSIAAVSQVHLTTKTQESPGIELHIDDGKMIDQREIGRGAGTEITISRLFENFPARKKFLRTATTELANIISTINQSALSHFRTSFELIHQEKKVFRYAAVENLKERIYQIYGPEMLEQLIPIDDENDPSFAMEGFISLPPHSHGTRSYQEFFVNKRPIRNPMISHAIYEAYSTHLMKGQNPAFIFFIHLDPSRVDVNVHPSKKEVRFSDSSVVHQKVYGKVKKTLAGHSGILLSPPVQPAELHFKVKEAVTGYLNSVDRVNADRKAENLDIFSEEKADRELSYKVLGQFHSMFMLVQSGEELQIIDQHAAHERVLFERFLNQYARETVLTQPLLIPCQLDLTFKDMMVLEEHEKSLQEIGFEFEKFGEKTILVRSVPAFLSQTDIPSLFDDLLEEIQMFQKVFSGQERLEKMIATLACHGAVKAGDPLGQTEMSSLYRDLMQIDVPLTCPHGRPITKRFSLKELERIFCRT